MTLNSDTAINLIMTSNPDPKFGHKPLSWTMTLILTVDHAHYFDP
jgi:hypothetical protein